MLKECHSESANTIANRLSKEFKSVLKTIAENVYKKTKELIPVAANKPNLKNWPLHRKLLMFLSRSRKVGLDDKERINNLKLFILENNEVPNFLAMRIKGTYFGIDNPSMLQILDIVTHPPDNEILIKEKYSPKFQFDSVDSEMNQCSGILDEYNNILQKTHEQPKIPF